MQTFKFSFHNPAMAHAACPTYTLTHIKTHRQGGAQFEALCIDKPSAKHMVCLKALRHLLGNPRVDESDLRHWQQPLDLVGRTLESVQCHLNTVGLRGG